MGRHLKALDLQEQYFKQMSCDCNNDLILSSSKGTCHLLPVLTKENSCHSLKWLTIQVSYTTSFRCFITFLGLFFSFKGLFPHYFMHSLSLSSFKISSASSLKQLLLQNIILPRVSNHILFVFTFLLLPLQMGEEYQNPKHHE